ncbi:MAG: spore coat protein CotJB [Bacillota bacterium]
MRNEQLSSLKEIMALEFTLVDLHLYLDTHPSDSKALSDYNTIFAQLSTLKNNYEETYGPITPRPSARPWQWISEPWPWDMEY